MDIGLKEPLSLKYVLISGLETAVNWGADGAEVSDVCLRVQWTQQTLPNDIHPCHASKATSLASALAEVLLGCLGGLWTPVSAAGTNCGAVPSTPTWSPCFLRDAGSLTWGTAPFGCQWSIRGSKGGVDFLEQKFLPKKEVIVTLLVVFLSQTGIKKKILAFMCRSHLLNKSCVCMFEGACLDRIIVSFYSDVPDT